MTKKEGGSRLWMQTSEVMKGEIGAGAWKRWIEPLKYKGDRAGAAEIAAPSDFSADWVNRHYADAILGALKEVGAACTRVKIFAEKDAEQGALPNEAELAATMVDNALNSAPLDRRFTFEQFVVGRPNELAHAAARRVAEGEEVTFNPVFLHGGVGLGKTHLMHAINWRINELYPDCKVLYLSAEQFMYRFIQAIRHRSTMDFKEQFRSVDVLMVDDVQFIAGKDSTQEEFFHTFNALIDEGKQIVISGDRAPGEIDGLENRIKSRLQWGLVRFSSPSTTNFASASSSPRRRRRWRKTPASCLSRRCWNSSPIASRPMSACLKAR